MKIKPRVKAKKVMDLVRGDELLFAGEQKFIFLSRSFDPQQRQVVNIKAVQVNAEHYKQDYFAEDSIVRSYSFHTEDSVPLLVGYQVSKSEAA